MMAVQQDKDALWRLAACPPGDRTGASINWQANVLEFLSWALVG